MSNDLITWKEENPADEGWSDILGTINEDEVHAYNRAALEQQQEAQREAESNLYTIPESELLARWQKDAEKLEAVTLEQKQVDAVHRFITATPELVLNQKTMTRIDAYLKAAGLDASDPSHFDAAYKSLAARKLIDIDESKRVRAPYQRLSEQDLYNMPEAELEELAREQLR